jgi:hypothetical protein
MRHMAPLTLSHLPSGATCAIPTAAFSNVARNRASLSPRVRANASWASRSARRASASLRWMRAELASDFSARALSTRRQNASTLRTAATA